MTPLPGGVFYYKELPVLLKKKPVDDTKLNFAKMGAKPIKPDVENAADAKKPGDKKEDVKKSAKKKKGPGLSFYSKKAAAALAKGE
jgi:hypothetical protein